MKTFVFNGRPYPLSKDELSEVEIQIYNEIASLDFAICNPVRYKVNKRCKKGFVRLTPEEVFALLDENDKRPTVERVDWNRCGEYIMNEYGRYLSLEDVSPIPYRLFHVSIVLSDFLVYMYPLHIKVEDIVYLVKHAIDDENFNGNTLREINPSLYNQIVSKKSLLSKMGGLLILSSADHMVSQHTSFRPQKAEVGSINLENGGIRRIIADIKEDEISYHEETIIDGNIISDSVLRIDKANKFTDRIGTYTSNCTLMVSKQLFKDTDMTINTLAKYLERQQLSFTIQNTTV